MDTLSERFNALQENLMDIYESGRDDIETQIMHWQYLRQEQVLFYFARKHGVMRLGYQPVPPLATSEAKAKDAIGMVILLQSLQKSPFGKESWTLTQTSLETVRSPPANCFKKGPQNIEVMFDNDPENLMVYTAWSYIYYQTLDDTWNKVEGKIDYHGAYYLEGTLKVYYIQFESDAARYGKSGIWEVHVNEDTIFAPVTSSSPAAGERAATSIDSASQSPPNRQPTATSVSTRKRTPPRRRYKRKASSPTTTTTRRQKRQGQREEDATRSTSRGRQEISRGGDQRRRRRSRETSTSPTRGRGSRRGPTTRSQSRSLSRSRSRSSSRGGISPADVGSSVRSVGRHHTGRLERLLEEARDPPVIVLRGDANKLKCFRFRAKKKYQELVKYYSTTWSWVGGTTNDRIGRSRMLLAFSSNTERELFINIMKLPPGVDWSLGSLDDL
uniref:Regulatory protein E2 n=1 Tax=Human papillomavirus TaxID=10566 RepID=A0A386AT53_9PAPI|nr:MAG: E2 protein [Human papillomavirus]